MRTKIDANNDIISWEIQNMVSSWERPNVTFKEAMSSPYPCEVHDKCTATFWVQVDGEAFDLSLCLLSEFPYPYPNKEILKNTNICPEHNIDFEIQNIGLDEILIYDYKRRTEFRITDWMIENGIAPYVPFKIRLEVCYHHVGGYDDEDWDCEYDYEILEIKSKSEDELTHQQLWEMWAKDIEIQHILIG